MKANFRVFSFWIYFKVTFQDQFLQIQIRKFSIKNYIGGKNKGLITFLSLSFVNCAILYLILLIERF